MEKLAAADAGFIYAETKRCNSNIASVNILELADDQTPASFISSLKAYLRERSHLVPYMTRKLAFVPGNWDHPVWVQDRDFDISNHVIEYPVAYPGGRKELEEAVAAIHEIKMPLERPLWAWHILTGLENGRVAVYNQAHHAALDGASGNAAYVTLMDETPEHPEIEAPETATSVDEDQTMLRLLEDAVENFMRFQMDAPRRMFGAMDTSRRLMARAIDPSKDFGAMSKLAPATRFNRQISEKRAWATGEFSLPEVKRLGKSIGGTINDIILAICAEGLRSYLERHGELPEESLIAGCPVSVREPGDTRPGTQVTMMNVELNTQIADPLERIFAIRASAHTAKEMVADLAGVFESNAAMPGMPAMLQAQLNAAESYGLANFFRGPVNLCLSNVPGPRNSLYANRAEMQSHYPVSIATHGCGLNITVQSYRDEIFMGITTCAESVPDLEVLRDDMLAAYEALRARLLPNNVKPFRQESAPEQSSDSDSAVVQTTGPETRVA